MALIWRWEIITSPSMAMTRRSAPSHRYCGDAAAHDVLDSGRSILSMKLGCIEKRWKLIGLVAGFQTREWARLPRVGASRWTC